MVVDSCEIRKSVMLCLYCADSREGGLEPEGKCVEIFAAASFADIKTVSCLVLEGISVKYKKVTMICSDQHNL